MLLLSPHAGLEANGRSAVVADISAGIKAGPCACDLRNPQGSCCLGNVRGVVERWWARRRGQAQRSGEDWAAQSWQRPKMAKCSMRGWKP